MAGYEKAGKLGVISVYWIREKDGKTTNHREALCPGAFNRARELLPEAAYAEIQALWTPEVIGEWERLGSGSL